VRDDLRYRKLFDYLGFAELMAVLMVLATAFSAVATWRTASIANALYNASERPYVGVEKVSLERLRPDDCHVVVQYRNFGSVAAEDAVVTERLFVDGRPVAHRLTIKAGILSPNASHHMFLHVPAGQLDSILSGRSRLSVVVAASYHGPVRFNLCYAERFTYVPETKTLQVDGGSPRCSDIGQWIDGGPRH
jgi:hypothetical protein